jgi:predicted O-linked N-acetylglucosamine transferase (SPINDLY family)
LNDVSKLNPRVLQLWASVLLEVGGSRLLLHAPVGAARRRISGQLESAGVDAERIEFVERVERTGYLATYRRIDVGLDCFPCNGGATTLDALWMGVPVVTLVGRTFVGRAGLSLARNVGLEECVAWDPDEFVRVAIRLSADLPRLNELRLGLRARLEKSPLMDAPRFARDLELAYRTAWRNWCSAS